MMHRTPTVLLLTALSALSAVFAPVLLAGCSDDGSPSAAAGNAGASGSGGSGGTAGTEALPGPAEWNRPVTIPSDDTAKTGRESCTFKAGALPDESQGTSAPRGKDIPVENIVVVMMENRSFDHYFQKAPEKGIDVEVAPADFSNKDSMGKVVTISRDKTYCIPDTNHEWGAVHQQIGGGKMDGFVTSNEQNTEDLICGTLDGIKGDRAMVYYEEDDIPFVYWAARNFSVGDHYHCSLVGPTWPNRMYLYAGSSFGVTDSSFPPAGQNTIFDELNAREITWKVYKSTTPGFAVIFDKYLDLQDGHLFNIEDFYTDAAAGTLPQVTFVDPGIGREGYHQNDEHPPAIMEIGQNFLGTVTDTMIKSPQWSKSAMFVTYDEHGGFYDHVVPPKACAPDDFKAGPKADPQVGFEQLGIRVPFFVISPFAKKGFVGHHVYDHTSITRFIEARYTLPALTNRDANAEIPWEMFDFDGVPNAKPAAALIPTIDQAKIDACNALCTP